ncbi:disulfide bond formation protein DsbB [Candidatus Puniceispirillum marinum]|jgi:hypothetical protein|uniref:Disulfide bond formation protein DsbB n=1 Tax=Puniceispirillum marinum (strain IMCC1322) TaxID=488538 RepID=D5BPU5_PUNMI|nr:disulfide bond formation protein DsbB [Candidatus Puniceispirillum marinum]ADE40597.1 Disulfide bond formation protein DsbB [Candidatus Puniceispirillum marinum IMCC1322]
MSDQNQSDKNQSDEIKQNPDRSLWIMSAVLVLVAVAILPFAARHSSVVRSIASMCGFDLG